MTAPIDSRNVEVLTPSEDSEKNVENNISTGNYKTEFSRKTVESLGNKVRITDKDEATGLELFCYVKCGRDDDFIMSNCRGVVFHGNNIIMRAFPYTVEYDHTEEKNIYNSIQESFKDSFCYDSQEGTLIRMFYFSGKWYTSTHRKLNAFRSRWSSNESFGNSFKRALESEIENNVVLRDSLDESIEGTLERFQNILDKSKQYMFLVKNNEENRIVCDSPSRPTLFHVGTFVKRELVMTENINVPSPRKHIFSNVEELIKYVKNADIREIQGVIVFSPNNKQYKIVNKNYKELFDVRGNEPSIKFRYLQVRMNSSYLNRLYDLYPNMYLQFEDYENAIFSIAKNIYNSYVQRFIKKMWVTVSTEEYNVIRACHSWHEKNRKENRINLEKVIEKLNEQTATNINKMIRLYKSQKKRINEQQNNKEDNKEDNNEDNEQQNNNEDNEQQNNNEDNEQQNNNEDNEQQNNNEDNEQQNNK